MSVDPKKWTPFVRDQPQARARLFCFHHAGGDAAFFRGWGDLAPDWLEVRPIRLPGRWTRAREQTATSLDALVAAMVPDLSPLLDRPFAFLGISLGALVAFAAARRLRDEKGDHLLRYLFVCARRAPDRPPPLPWLHTLDDEQLLQSISERNDEDEAGRPGDRSLERRLLPLLRADLKLGETHVHVPGEPLGIPIAAISGSRDPVASADLMREWKSHTTGAFSEHTFDGKHFFIADHEKEIVQRVSSLLEATLGPARRKR